MAQDNHSDQLCISWNPESSASRLLQKTGRGDDSGGGEGEPCPGGSGLTSSGGCRTFCRYFFNTSSGVFPVGTGWSVGRQDKLDMPERGALLARLRAFRKKEESSHSWI